MSIELESLLVAIAFIVPGFLTSKLISARTASRKIDSSVFEDTAESILRSVYINLFVAGVVLAVYLLFVRDRFPSYSSDLELIGILPFVERYPILSFTAVVVWLLLAFIIAIIFGAKVDPLHALMLLLSESKGGLSVDSFSLLRDAVIQRRGITSRPSRLWLRVRMKSGDIYRGEFVSSTYREPGLDREILLANAFYVSINAQDQNNSRGEALDYVRLNLADSESVEFKYSDL